MRKKNNKWLSLWTRPTATFTQILETDPKRTIIPLAVLNGVLGAIIWLVSLWNRFPEERGEMAKLTPFFVIFALIGGVIVALITLYLGSLILQWAGRWIKGKGDYTAVKAAVGWSNYPFIVSGIFALIALIFYHKPMAALPFDIIKTVIYVWGVVIMVKMLAVAHRFSGWKGLLCLIIGLAIAIAAMILFSLIGVAIIPEYTHLFQ